ncbi:MAG: polysaccharide deacetylase family protein [Clostridia bacterium]|nr:polysaccharide deacetylase family protein [Clostridia bacterium]
MKKLFCIVLDIIFCSLSILCTGANYSPYYQTLNVEHLFTHCLIAYPEIAFNNNNTMKNSYNTDCITKNEFIKILNSLYQNNYILVNINHTFKNQNNLIVKTPIKVPIGKKPLILSFDDVNYDHKKIGLGMVDKIVLDHSNNLAASTVIGNKEHISYTNEFIPILENFVKTHPDFSLNGAKATINLTGYDGILGYRTHSKNTLNRQAEIQKVTPIIKKLKENGWNFACHSFGHYHMSKITDEHFFNEIKLWKTEVEPLIGETKIYVYPYGDWQVYQNGELCQKHIALQNSGFELFCGVGMKTFFSYLPTSCKNKVLFMDRKVIDGTTLRSNNINLLPFFSPRNVYDYSVRPS